MNYYRSGALAIVLALAASLGGTNAAQHVTNVSKNLTRAGAGGIQFGGQAFNLNLGGEIRSEPEVDVQFGKGGGINQSRVPSSGVPKPGGNGLAPLDANFFGFPGVNHRQQRLADHGQQFS